ncbi:MAG: DUF2007 domain-containing protein [Clostridia bacterium]
MKESGTEEKYLMTANNSMEADLTESLLKAHGIATLRKYKGIDAYLKVVAGGSRLGVDFYVREVDLEQAKEILDAMAASEDMDISDMSHVKEKKTKTAAWIYIGFILLTFLAAVMVMIMNKN